MTYYCYALWTPDLWNRWVRRLARETRTGTWLITVATSDYLMFLHHSLQRLRLRCCYHITVGDLLAFEYIPAPL